MRLRFRDAADEDLRRIFVDGVAAFGAAAATRYAAQLKRAVALIAEFPRLARTREEVTGGVRAHPCGVHVIVYELEDDDVVILRIRHGREDWQSDPV